MNKKLPLIAVLLLAAFFTNAQEMKTLINKDSIRISSFGGIIVEAPMANGEVGFLVGGKGGLIINKQFAFGGIGKGMVSGIPVVHKGMNRMMTYNAGGLFLEYILMMNKPIHLSFPVNAMYGNVEVGTERAQLFFFEPGVNVEFNFTHSFILALNANYRFPVGYGISGFSNKDVGGLGVGLNLKFGSFN